MSYQEWHSPTDNEKLRSWIMSVTTKLVAEKRYEDVAKLMLVVNDFESLSSMAAIEGDNAAQEFISITICELASRLSQIEWQKEKTNQDIYMILQNLSDFIQLNELNCKAVFSTHEPHKFILPDSVKPRVSLNF
jgi:hypothetical protein